MRRWIRLGGGVVCLISWLPAQDRGPGSVQLDGRLNDPAWLEAKMTVDLVQQSPKPGAPAPYRTRVSVLVHDNKLYFGFECADPDPGAIAVHTMQRDGKVEGDDTVAIVRDTYGGRRTGYFFRVNAAGARVDGLVAGAEEPRLDWDGIWDARTARTPDGWSAEIVHPGKHVGLCQRTGRDAGTGLALPYAGQRCSGCQAAMDLQEVDR